MRRGLMRFLPVFLLALTVQILAPIGACFATALAASDPLSAAVLCRSVSPDHASDQQPNHHMRDGSCAACAAVTPFTPAAPQPVPIDKARHIYRVVWLAFAPDALTAKITSSPQARAPPILS